MIVLAILFIVAGIDFAYRMRRQNVVLQHKFRLYALRDALRESVIKGDVKSSNWVFQYLDSTIAKLIDSLPFISVWKLGSMLLFTPADPKLQQRLVHLMHELKKPENKPLASVYFHLMGETGYFISHRHGSLWILLRSAFRLVNSGKWLKEKFRFGKEFLTVSPETSTLQRFISC